MLLRYIFEQCFKAIITLLAPNNYPDSQHLQEGMTFATQISPLIDFNRCYNIKIEVNSNYFLCAVKMQHFCQTCLYQK